MSTAGPVDAYGDLADRRHAALRSQFLLDPDVVFLNHGSFGACPKPVFQHYQAWQRELERQPVEFLARRLLDLLADARRPLGALLGADVDDLVYVTNATLALNIIARSLPLEPGDEILTTDHEYGALQRTWTFVAEHRRARIVEQPLPLPIESPDEIVEAIWAGVTPRTRVLFLSHITSGSAVVLPVAPLIARARQAGIWTVLDEAHGPGQIEVDLGRLGVDFAGGNLHKWVCAAKGAGFLYARREVQHLLEPLVISWGWRSADPRGSPFVDQFERQGTHDPAAYLSVPTAIDFQAEHHWPRIRAECHELVRLARTQIPRVTGVEPLLADDPRLFAQMVALPLPPCDTATLKQRLYDDYRVEIPITWWAQRPCLRVSAQGYNTRADIEYLVTAMADVLPHVRVTDS